MSREASAARFYAVLAALLFTAACAWIGAALFAPLEGGLPAAAPRPETEAKQLRGVLLREELLLPADAFPDAREGRRLSAAETGLAAGRYYSESDGYAFLSPADAEELSPAALDVLLALPPEKSDGARLVTGWDCRYAALFEGADAPAVGTRCRLRFDGAAEPLEALVLRASQDETGRTALLFRLTAGAEALDRERFADAEIVS